jgi:alpha/beta superfamily hydrolase
MMADHSHTVVPEAALDAIVAWIGRHAPPAEPPAVAQEIGASSVTLAIEDEASGEARTVEEVLCRFGDEGHLMGVLARPDADPTRPAIVMFNGGAVHHVGPNRLYVTLARSLAAMGFACLRFDLEGIGDSVLRGPGRENHPYPPQATQDAHAAIAFLRERFGHTHFVALGLCSGAHTAFHTALQLEREDIHEVILINPYAFYWKEGMSLDVAHKLADAQQYKKSMRDPSRWLKLLRGDVNVRRLLDVALQYPKTVGRSYMGALCETLVPSMAPPLARDLRRLFESRRKVTVLVSEGDPGGELLMRDAKWTATRGLRRGDLSLETIVGGDHTFTQSRPRRDLIERVAAHLRPCLEAQGHSGR